MEGNSTHCSWHLESNLSLKAKGWRPDAIQNTYLKEFEVPQIVLSDILTNRFPLLQKAQYIAEKAIERFVRIQTKNPTHRAGLFCLDP